MKNRRTSPRQLVCISEHHRKTLILCLQSTDNVYTTVLSPTGPPRPPAQRTASKKKYTSAIYRHASSKMFIAGARGHTRAAEAWTVNLLLPTNRNQGEYDQSGKNTFMPCIAQFPKLQHTQHRRPFMLYSPKYLLNSCKVNIFLIAFVVRKLHPSHCPSFSLLFISSLIQHSGTLSLRRCH